MVDVLTSRMTGQTVTIKSRSSTNFEGDETYGSGTDYDCRVDRVDREMLDSAGKLVMAEAIVNIPGNVSVTNDDKIELSNGDAPEIIKVNKERDIEGTIRFTRIMTGRPIRG